MLSQVLRHVEIHGERGSLEIINKITAFVNIKKNFILNWKRNSIAYQIIHVE
jgi:hypothetical protein